jgi:ethanolamine utilization microcompartment shell protein EutS
MTDSIVQEWKKELRVLLDHVAAHPSSDLTQKRERIVILQKLVSERSRYVDA